MALNIKDPESERLAAEIAALTGESKTGAIRVALRERKERLAIEGVAGEREAALRRLLEEEIWPFVPPEERGRTLTREEEDEPLGYGPDGV